MHESAHQDRDEATRHDGHVTRESSEAHDVEASRDTGDPAEITRVSGQGGDPEDFDEAPLLRGTAIGRYVVLDVVGEGGMGIVYSAYDPHLERKVALKLLRVQRAKEGADDNLSAGQQRLLREAQAMAKLSHPNVVAVYDAGIAEDRVFIAAEFVEGETLREWLRRPHKWQDIVRVFVAAGRGLAAAHARGIVHRDFKPHNVLIDKLGAVRVMDFGLARRIDDPGNADESARELAARSAKLRRTTISEALTRVGTVVGTPGYMAPEQFMGGEVGPAADQFSFCASLFQALYGERPFRGRTLRDLGRAVFRGEVTIPEPERRVPKWLKRLVMRGLAVESTRRWPSMEALLAELSRDRRKRWVQTGVAASLVGAAVSLGLLYGKHVEQRALVCSGAADKLAGIWDTGTKAKLKAVFQASGLAYATDAWNRVELGLEAYANTWVDQYGESCAATRVRQEQSERVMDLQMSCLADARAELSAVTKLLAHADADVVKNSVKIVSSLRSLDACTDLRSLESAATRDVNITPEQLEPLRERLADVKFLYLAGKYEPSARRAQALLEQVQGMSAPRLTAEVLFHLGMAQTFHGEAKLGSETLREAMWAADAARMDTIAADARTQLLFVTGYYLHDLEGARSWTRHAQAAIARIGGDHRREAKLAYCLATIEFMEGRFEQALAHYREATRMLELALGPDDLELAGPLNAIGVVLQNRGAYDDARPYIERAAALWIKHLGPRYPDTAATHSNLGSIEEAQGHYESALARHAKSIEMLSESLKADHTYLVEARTYAASAALKLGDAKQARTVLEPAIAALGGMDNEQQPALGVPLYLLGSAMAMESESTLVEAKHLETRALAMLGSTYGDSHLALASPLLSRARIHMHMNDVVQARADATTAVALLERSVGDKHPHVGEALVIQAEIELAAEDWPASERTVMRALEILRVTLRPNHPELGRAWSVLGRSRLASGRKLEGTTALEQANAIQAAQAVAPGDLGVTRFALARAIVNERPFDARQLARQADEDLARAGWRFAAQRRDIAAWQAAQRASTLPSPTD